MSKKIYTLAMLVLYALSASNISTSPELYHTVYSVHDACALVLGDPAQMYACGFGSEWNAFTGCHLAVLICAGIFVYSNSYAYPEGFRTMSILRFGSEKRYWKNTMRRNLRHVVFAATVLMVCALGTCAAFTAKTGFGAVRFVSYGAFPVVYLLFWGKMMVFLTLLSIFAEVFAQRLPQAGIISGTVICTTLLFSVDILQKKTAILVTGSWQAQAGALLVLFVITLVLLIYGRLRSLLI